MYFKVKNSTKLFKQLNAVKERIIEANEAARLLVIELVGHDDYYRKSFPYIGGGISAIVCKERPKDWQSMAAKFGKPSIYMPKNHSKGKEIWDKINALPLVKTDEVYDLLNYPKGTLITPGVRFANDVVIIQIDESIEYTPVKGMTEIVASEFKKLSEIITKEQTEDASNNKEESEDAN